MPAGPPPFITCHSRRRGRLPGRPWRSFRAWSWMKSPTAISAASRANWVVSTKVRMGSALTEIPSASIVGGRPIVSSRCPVRANDGDHS